MASSKLEKLQEQVEYYLSDENLTTDDFFRNEIKSTPEV